MPAFSANVSETKTTTVAGESPAACRLCQAGHPAVRFRIGRVTVQSCTACGFVQVAERPAAAELRELYSQAYFDHGKYSDAFALRKEHERRLSLLRGCGLRPGARVLDAGCATGDFIAAAGEYEMWGLDISEFAAEQARRRNPTVADRIHSGPIEDQDYPDGHFDAIVMWDVLEHLWDPAGVCRSMLRILKAGGLLCVSTPNIGASIARIMGRRWAFMTVPEHLGFFDRGTMRMLMEARLGLRLEAWRSKGKWVNCGFFLYKLKRIFPRAIPRLLVEAFRTALLRRLAVYVPTGDIQYAAARKIGASKDYP